MNADDSGILEVCQRPRVTGVQCVVVVLYVVGPCRQVGRPRHSAAPDSALSALDVSHDLTLLLPASKVQTVITTTIKTTHALYWPRLLTSRCDLRDFHYCFCLTSVSLSVAYIGPNSRTERPRKTKIGTEVAHVTRDSGTTFKVERSTCC